MKFVATSTTGVRSTFGRFGSLVKPGLRFFVPFIQRIDVVSNRLHQSEFKFEVKTSDGVFSYLSLAVQFHVKCDNSDLAFYSLDNPDKQMSAYIESVLIKHASTIDLTTLFKSQETICETVSKHLSPKMEQYGYTIENTLVTRIDPNKEVKDSLNKLEASKRAREAAEAEADAEYIKAVKIAEADKQRKILQGEGTAEQRRAIVEGYKKSISEFESKFGSDPKDVMDFVIKTQYIDALGHAAASSNAKVVFLEHDASPKRKHVLEAIE